MDHNRLYTIIDTLAEKIQAQGAEIDILQNDVLWYKEQINTTSWRAKEETRKKNEWKSYAYSLQEKLDTTAQEAEQWQKAAWAKEKAPAAPKLLPRTPTKHWTTKWTIPEWVAYIGDYMQRPEASEDMVKSWEKAVQHNPMVKAVQHNPVKAVQHNPMVEKKSAVSPVLQLTMLS